MPVSPNRTARIVATGLYRDVAAPKHRTLFLPRFLAAKANENRWEGPDRDAAHAIIKQWANLADTHALDHKEASAHPPRPPQRVWLARSFCSARASD